MTSGSQEYSTVFTRLIEQLAITLDQFSIKYMIIGGQAVLIYGEPRLTKDIDVTLALDSNNLTTLAPAVEKLNLKPLTDDPRDFVRRTSVLPVKDDKTGIRIDFIFSFTPYERQAIEHARKVRIGEADVTYASPEDIVIHKVFSGRARDIEDVRAILRKNTGLNADYIRKWLKSFDASSNGDCLDTFAQIFSEEVSHKPAG